GSRGSRLMGEQVHRLRLGRGRHGIGLAAEHLTPEPGQLLFQAGDGVEGLAAYLLQLLRVCGKCNGSHRVTLREPQEAESATGKYLFLRRMFSAMTPSRNMEKATRSTVGAPSLSASGRANVPCSRRRLKSQNPPRSHSSILDRLRPLFTNTNRWPEVGFCPKWFRARAASPS